MKRDLDTTMKAVVSAAAPDLLPQFGIHEPVKEWLTTELVAFHRKADLVGKLLSGSILHLELQARNDPEMAPRMLDYCVRIYRPRGVVPIQFVLYFGWNRLRMRDSIADGGLTFRYRLLDMRQLDGVALLRSAIPEANILACWPTPNRPKWCAGCANTFTAKARTTAAA